MVNRLSTRAVATGPSLKSTNWTNFAAAVCGLWLACNVTMTEKSSPEILINNIVCGGLVFGLSLIAFNQRAWLRWVVAAIGTWLLFAPLVFRASEPFLLDSSMLIGTAIIAFSFLIPGQPYNSEPQGADIPAGWSYNPSSWEQRGPLIALAFIGFFLARYLAAFQMGYISSVWDPFFGNGTEKVLHSEISKAFVISDAGLGAVSYLIDALEGFLGGRARWRTMPWAVILFAASIVPAGVTSIVLVMLQPIGVGAWCTICLVAAGIMLLLVPYSFDELVATVQFLKRSKARGESFWRTLFFGGVEEPDASAPAEKSTKLSGFTGVNFPINLLGAVLLGIFIMASPALGQITNTGADSQHLTGALIVTVAVTSLAEACRACRFLNIVCALWLGVSVFVLPGFSPEFIGVNVLAGLLLILLSLPKGKIEEKYGSFDKFVR